MSAVAFHHVTLAYGGRRVLNDVSFAIPEGSFVALLGANGAGKTTLLRAALGLVRPESGSISVLGRPPGRGNAAIGYMPQVRRFSAHPGLSGFDLALSSAAGHRWGWPAASKADHSRVWEALDAVGAAGLARRPVAELSGGERQRILIAQTLIGRPKLLLLDEPLISLDAAHQRATVALVRELGKRLGIAVLFCSHEINPLIGAADAVLYLGNGQAAIGTVDEVITAPVLSKLYGAPIHVVRAEGRIFVLADGIDLEGGAHVHDH